MFVQLKVKDIREAIKNIDDDVIVTVEIRKKLNSGVHAMNHITLSKHEDGSMLGFESIED